jgi:hypothetical protein
MFLLLCEVKLQYNVGAARTNSKMDQRLEQRSLVLQPGCFQDRIARIMSKLY